MTQISPLAPAAGFPAIPPVAGVRLAARACGVNVRGRKDVLLAEFPKGAAVAGVFATSSMPSAAVDWCRGALKGGRANALVVNSGNANAFTGRAGREAAAAMAGAAARLVGCPHRRVFVSSTGVIGEKLPYEKIVNNLPALRKGLGADWKGAAKAIMTTDTFPKGAVRTAQIGGTKVTLAGIAKGSGMIAPNLATMLAYVFTDARVPAKVLQPLLARAADRSFNAITVDSDSSTNDTVLAFATGQARHARVNAPGEAHLRDFKRQLDEVMIDLAQQIVRDGEGATKFVTITVSGARNPAAARRIGLVIGNSPLVKTAIAGEDANWGRIVMAVGKSGEAADRDRLAIAMGGVQVALDGEVVPGYDEAPVAAHMKGDEIVIEVDVGVGRGRATVWTCDLTHGYITINADYRT